MKAFLVSAVFIFPAISRAAAGESGGPAVLAQKEELVRDAEARIQRLILDEVLGKDRAAAFVELEADVKSAFTRSAADGSAEAEKVKRRPGKGDLPGFPPAPGGRRPVEELERQSDARSRGEGEGVYSQSLVVRRFRAVVIHDAGVPPEKLREVRSLIVEAMARYGAGPQDIVFKRAEFTRPPVPAPPAPVPVPPAPAAKPAELRVSVPSVYGWFLLGVLVLASALVVGTLGRPSAPESEPAAPAAPPRAPEPGLAPSAAEERGLFGYVNEGNVQRLAWLLLLRRDSPERLAAVLSCLGPALGRRLLDLLPPQLQAQSALEAVRVRQLPKDELRAVEADIGEQIDFVAGGAEPLARMLELADAQTRANVLDFLRRERPELDVREQGGRVFIGGAAAPGEPEAAAPAAGAARARAAYEEGLKWHEAGDPARAAEHFRRAAQGDPELWEARQCLGFELFLLGQLREALLCLEKVLEARPDPELASWVEGCQAKLGTEG